MALRTFYFLSWTFETDMMIITFVVIGSFYPSSFSLSFLPPGLVGCLSFLPRAFVPNCISLSIFPVELVVSSFLSFFLLIFSSFLFWFEHNQPQESHFLCVVHVAFSVFNMILFSSSFYSLVWFFVVWFLGQTIVTTTVLKVRTVLNNKGVILNYFSPFLGLLFVSICKVLILFVVIHVFFLMIFIFCYWFFNCVFGSFLFSRVIDEEAFSRQVVFICQVINVVFWRV